MILLYFFPLCIYMAGIHLDVVGSDMCDDGWVYNSNTATCLQNISVDSQIEFLQEGNNPCLNKNGGEFRNISGQVVEFTEAIEPFLRYYLQFMKLPEAGVDLSPWLRSFPNIYIWYKYFNEGQRAYFVPGKPIPFQDIVSGNPPIICQVKAGPIEPPVCPRDVTLVSVSDKNATLSWRPGQLGRKVVVYITVQICDVPSSCRNSTSITFGDVSLFQQMNYTVSGLQPNEMYKLTLQIQNDTFGTKDCNVTLSLSTTEEKQGQESSAAVIGFAVSLSISLLACSVLAILLFRYYRQAKKDKNSDIDKIVTKMMKQTSSKQETKLQGDKTTETNSALYHNDQVEPHEYEKTIENQDDHIYEL